MRPPRDSQDGAGAVDRGQNRLSFEADRIDETLARFDIPNEAVSPRRARVGPSRFRADSASATDRVMQPRVSLILPTLNEAEGMADILPRIPDTVDQVIVVDGNSTDDTRAVVRRLRPDALLVVQRGRGKGNALKHGLAVADGDIIVTMDADASMSPEDIGTFVAELVAGADFVKGSRILPGAGSADFTKLRWFGNHLLTAATNALFGAQYTDITYGYNAYWRSTIHHLGCLADGFEFEIQAAVRATMLGMHTAEVATHEAARVGGESKLRPVADGMAILRLLMAEASHQRAARFGAGYDAEAQQTREILREQLLADVQPIRAA